MKYFPTQQFKSLFYQLDKQNDIRLKSIYYWFKRKRTLACETVSSETSVDPFTPAIINLVLEQ